ncbi:MAG: hypothetical protein AAF353_16530, partial [Pseudomonadota bacterium]
HTAIREDASVNLAAVAEFREATPVIMLSSKDSIFDRARGRIVGSEKYLTKPFSKEDLINAITTHVG